MEAFSIDTQGGYFLKELLQKLERVQQFNFSKSNFADRITYVLGSSFLPELAQNSEQFRDTFNQFFNEILYSADNITGNVAPVATLKSPDIIADVLKTRIGYFIESFVQPGVSVDGGGDSENSASTSVVNYCSEKEKLHFLFYKVMFHALMLDLHTSAEDFVRGNDKLNITDLLKIFFTKYAAARNLDLENGDLRFYYFEEFESFFGEDPNPFKDATLNQVFCSISDVYSINDLSYTAFETLKQYMDHNLDILGYLYKAQIQSQNTEYLSIEDLYSYEEAYLSDFVNAIMDYYEPLFRQDVQGNLCAFDLETQNNMFENSNIFTGFSEDIAETRNLLNEGAYNVLDSDSNSLSAPVAKVYTLNTDAGLKYCSKLSLLQDEKANGFTKRGALNRDYLSKYDYFSELLWLSISSSVRLRPFKIQPFTDALANTYSSLVGSITLDFSDDDSKKSVFAGAKSNCALWKTASYYPYTPDLFRVFSAPTGKSSEDMSVLKSYAGLLSVESRLTEHSYLSQCVNYLPDFHATITSKKVYAYILNKVNRSDVPVEEYLADSKNDNYVVFVCSASEALKHRGGLIPIRTKSDLKDFVTATFLFYYKFLRDLLLLYRCNSEALKTVLTSTLFYLSNVLINSVFVLDFSETMLVFRLPRSYIFQKLDAEGSNAKKSFNFAGSGHPDIFTEFLKYWGGEPTSIKDFYQFDCLNSTPYLRFLGDSADVSKLKSLYTVKNTVHYYQSGASLDLQKYISLPEFAWRKYGEIFSTVKPSLYNVYLGRTIDNELISVNMGRNTDRGLALISGSRSGKGVQLLSINAVLLSLGLPLCYLDCKPEMSVYISAASKFWNRFRLEGDTVIVVDESEAIPTIPAMDLASSLYRTKDVPIFSQLSKFNRSLDGKLTADGLIPSDSGLSDDVYLVLKGLKLLYFYCSWVVYLAARNDMQHPLMVVDELLAMTDKIKNVVDSFKDKLKVLIKKQAELKKKKKPTEAEESAIHHIESLLTYLRSLYSMYLNVNDEDSSSDSKDFLNPNCKSTLASLLKNLAVISMGKSGALFFFVTQKVPSFTSPSQFSLTYPKMFYSIMSSCYLITGKNTDVDSGAKQYFLDGLSDDPDYLKYVQSADKGDSSKNTDKAYTVAKEAETSSIGYFMLKTASKGSTTPVMANAKSFSGLVIKPYLSFCENDIFVSTLAHPEPEFTLNYLKNLKTTFDPVNLVNQELSRSYSKIKKTDYSSLESKESHMRRSSAFNAVDGTSSGSTEPLKYLAETRVGLQGLVEYLFALGEALGKMPSEEVNRAFETNNEEFLNLNRAKLNLRLSENFNKMNDFLHQTIPGNENGEIYATVYDFISDFSDESLYSFDLNSQMFCKIDLDAAVEDNSLDNLGTKADVESTESADFENPDDANFSSSKDFYEDFSNALNGQAETPADESDAESEYTDTHSAEEIAMIEEEFNDGYRGTGLSRSVFEVGLNSLYTELVNGELSYDRIDFSNFFDENSIPSEYTYEDYCSYFYNYFVSVSDLTTYETVENTPDSSGLLYHYIFTDLMNKFRV